MCARYRFTLRVWVIINTEKSRIQTLLSKNIIYLGENYTPKETCLKLFCSNGFQNVHWEQNTLKPNMKII